MRIVSKGTDSCAVVFEWKELERIMGISFDGNRHEGCENRRKLKEGQSFDLHKFINSVESARFAWETKEKMKELLRECEENLDKVFFPIQPTKEKE